MRETLRIAALLAVLSLPGCRQEGQSRLDASEVPDWPLLLEARIGSMDDPQLGLTRVTQVVFGPQDNLYIAQSSENEIRVYDLKGDLLCRIGHDGEGPGEFRGISAIGFIGDTLFVTDPALRRFNLLEPDGRYLNSFSWTSIADAIPRPPVFYIPSGPQLVLDDGSALTQQGFGFMPGETREMPVPWLRIWRAAPQQATIAIERFDLGEVQTLTEQGHDFMFYPPIHDGPIYQLMADGSGLVIIERPIASGPERHTFRLVKISPAGDTILVREHTYIPVRIPPGEVDRQITAELESYSSGRPAPSREAVARIFNQDGFIPEYYPPVSSIRTGQDGRIWIERQPEDPSERVWNAISPAGEMEGKIRLPVGVQIMAARGDFLAAVDHDEFDVPYVLVYRIEF